MKLRSDTRKAAAFFAEEEADDGDIVLDGNSGAQQEVEPDGPYPKNLKEKRGDWYFKPASAWVRDGVEAFLRKLYRLDVDEPGDTMIDLTQEGDVDDPVDLNGEIMKEVAQIECPNVLSSSQEYTGIVVALAAMRRELEALKERFENAAISIADKLGVTSEYENTGDI